MWVHKVKAGLYRNGKFQIYKNNNLWYVYSKYCINDKSYDQYLGMFKTLKEACAEYNVEID